MTVITVLSGCSLLPVQQPVAQASACMIARSQEAMGRNLGTLGSKTAHLDRCVNPNAPACYDLSKVEKGEHQRLTECTH